MYDYQTALLCSFTVLGLAALIGGTIVVRRAFIHDASATAKAFRTLVRHGNGVRLATVFAVIFAVIFLALSDKLNDGIIALLSSIAGYTLGGLQLKHSDNNANED